MPASPQLNPQINLDLALVPNSKLQHFSDDALQLDLNNLGLEQAILAESRAGKGKLL